MRNCKLELEWETKAEFLSSFMEEMRMFGYNAREREETLRSNLTGWDRMVVEDKEGRRPINRAFSWKQKERREQKWRKKLSWFRSGGEYSSVMFCPQTPGGGGRWRTEVPGPGAGG